MTDDIGKLSYEQAYLRLEALVEQMEDAQLSLEESVALYEQGRRLAAHCQTLLEDAEQKIRLVDEASEAR